MNHYKNWLAAASVLLLINSCSKGDSTPGSGTTTPPVVVPPVVDTSIANGSHLNRLTVGVTFPNSEAALAVYIYADAPSYNPVAAPGEGFACVDDVARAVLFYTRNPNFGTDTTLQKKAYGLMSFIINMQSTNGYFYNFLQTGNTINQFGITSINQPKWWSWRALQALTEAEPVIRSKNTSLADKMAVVTGKLITAIKNNLVNLPQTTTTVDGIEVPQWLPEGADQGATLVLALVSYLRVNNDPVITTYLRKLADGIALSQQGGLNTPPYGAFLSSGTTWHAYGNDQASALFAAGQFLNEPSYIAKAKLEVDNFYPWMISSGYKSSFQLKKENNTLVMYNQQEFEQIAYGMRPMVFAAIDAYVITGEARYADMAGRLAAWFLGNNSANTYMYTNSNGICFDAIANGNVVNRNSGAESTIEALLAMQRIMKYPAVKTALNTYKK